MSSLAQELGSWSAPPLPPPSEASRLRDELAQLKSARDLEQTASWLGRRAPALLTPEADTDQTLVRACAALSETVLARIWDNPEDDIYDQL